LPDNQDESGDNINNDNYNDFDLRDSPLDGGISINKNYLEDLDPALKSSIEEFIKTLNGRLIDVSIPKEQKKALESQIEGITAKIKDMPINKKPQNNLAVDSVKSMSEDDDKHIAGDNKSLEINPQNADAYYNNKGLSLYYSGNHMEAIECYDKALEINPQNADAYNNKGLSLYYSGNHMEAIECYDKALEINPEFACAYYNKGIILSVNGYNNEAIECYDKALEINPQNADAYYNKGLSLSTLKNYPEAIECYDKALEINPQNADAYYNKGLSLSSIGNNAGAIECYDKALEINPPIRTCI
jgi:tetratricopeptide (TPR) repeat protein